MKFVRCVWIAAVALNASLAVAQSIGPWGGANPVSGGYNHPLALKSDGSLVSWGVDVYGEAVAPSPNTDFVSVAGGYTHSLALKSDGSIVGWGWDLWGPATVPSPNADFVSVAAGKYHSLGLKADGRIVAWGKNDYGQTAVPSLDADFAAVAAGSSHSLGLKVNGSIIAWGRNVEGQTTVPSPNTNFVAVAGGWYHSLGLKADGHVVAWGQNTYGQTNVPPPNEDFIAVAAGNYHSLGLKADGSIVAWGNNYYGQTTVPLPNADFVAVTGGSQYSLGLKADGSLSIWGMNFALPISVPLPNADYGQQSGVVPPRGQVAGGTQVAILGSHLGNGTDVTNVTLCGIAATVITQSQSRVLVSTGPAPGPITGDVVIYSASYPPIMQTNAFAYCPTPTVVTRGVTHITAWGAIGGGEVLSEEGYSVTDRGLCWGTAPNPSVSEAVSQSGSGLGAFTGVTLQNLSPGTRYHVRAWARSAIGVGYGVDVSFRTRCTVSASAGPFGTISPRGIVEIEEGGSVTFTITPDADSYVTNVWVDGTSIGVTNHYTFQNVVTNHTITARFSNPSPVDTHYVDVSSTNPVSPYTNWLTASATIQDAVDVASHGDTVLVTNGAYWPDLQIVITNGITVQSVNGAEVTIVDGRDGRRCFYLDHTNGVIDGFTITGGHTESSEDGGGVFCSHGIVRKCVVFDNYSGKDGGGVNLIDGGRAQHCLIRDNHAYDDGGGVHCDAGGTLVVGCVIVGNTAADDGGGIRCKPGGVVLNCTVVGNTAADGGGVYAASGGSFSNSIVFFNSASSGRDYFNSGTGMSYGSCCVPSDPGGIDNITSDPGFINSPTGDYHLSAGSLCIDAGTALTEVEYDLDGIPRPLDGDTNGIAAWDIGAYEFVNPKADTDGDGLTDGDEMSTYGTDPTQTNTDGDFHTDYEEMIANTDGTKSNDYFRITAMSNNSPVSVHFQSSTNRTYTLTGCSDLAEKAWSNVPGAGPRMGVGGRDELQDTNQPPRGPFYRLKVALP